MSVSFWFQGAPCNVSLDGQDGDRNRGDITPQGGGTFTGGFNSLGYDAEGYDRRGFDKKGFKKNGMILLNIWCEMPDLLTYVLVNI